MWKFGKGYGVRADSGAVVQRMSYGWEARVLGNVVGVFRLRKEAVEAAS